MSTCNSSGSSSPDSLHHFDGKHDSDTTPSPSGYRSPHFDPHTLSSKLAIYEASKSLSVAAKTLAAAAQAMSKAAASLAVASNALATKDVYDRTLVPESIFKSEDSSPNSGAWSPAWQQTSYVLSTNNTVSKPDYATRSKVLEADGLTPSAHIQYDRPPLSDKRSSGQENVDIPTSATPALESTLMSQLQTESTTSVPTTGNGNASGLVGAPEEHETMATSNEENRVTDAEVELRPDEVLRIPAISVATNLSEAGRKDIVDLTSRCDRELITNSDPNATFQPKFRLKLDRAFDELPAVIFLCQQYSKSICFYRYCNAGLALVDALRTWVGRPVMALLSLKPDQQAKRITKFLQGPATVLLWPSDVALSNEALLTLISKSSIQAIHIGGVSELNKDVTFTQVSIITTVAETSSADAEQKTTLEQYPIGSLNDACNEQGAASVLEPHRQVVRTSLAKAWPARALYKAFMVYHREHHPQWSAVYLVKQANQYAQEFLLRGEPGSKEGLIGGRVALASKYLDSWNLRAAVQSGYLLLAS